MILRSEVILLHLAPGSADIHSAWICLLTTMQVDVSPALHAMLGPCSALSQMVISSTKLSSQPAQRWGSAARLACGGCTWPGRAPASPAGAAWRAAVPLPCQPPSPCASAHTQCTPPGRAHTRPLLSQQPAQPVLQSSGVFPSSTCSMGALGFCL